MTAKIIDGKVISEKIRAQIKQEVQTLVQKHQKIPGLAVVLVGKDPASQIYVRNKGIACEKVGIQSFPYHLPEQTSAEELSHLLRTLSIDPQVDGILVQLPLPKHLKNFDVMAVLDPKKDVDGLHPLNLGKLMMGQKTFRSCTPFGMIKMLEEIDFPLEGKHAVVLGRSNIVGKPIGMMLLEKNATVTYCHSRTKDLPTITQQADVLVAAVGIPNFVQTEWVKEGAVILDVGINRLESGKVVGDVDYAACSEKASYITPVPGGVGPMTITMLLWNTVESAKTKVEGRN